MSRFDALAATLGTLLIENTPAMPWRHAVPEAFPSARGWYLPSEGGTRFLFLMRADVVGPEGVAEAIAAWPVWMAEAGAGESLLVMAYDELPMPDAPLGEPGMWPVWAVGMKDRTVARHGVPDEGQPFLTFADNLLASYLAGHHLKPDDLNEQEDARMAGRPPFSAYLRQQRTPATWVLLGMIGVMFALTELAGGSEKLSVMWRAGVNFRPLIEDGQWWRLVSANFLHFGFMHIALNAYSLFAVGPMLERVYGTRRYLAIYVIAGVTGAIASMVLGGGSSAGASGALFGLLGAMLFTGLKHQAEIPNHFRGEMRNIALITLAINMAYGFTHKEIDNFAHLGGLVGGFVMAALLGPNPVLLGRRTSQWGRWLLDIPPAVAVVALVWSLVYWASGKAPEVTVHGPARDYAVRVPLDYYYGETEKGLFMAGDNRQRWIELLSSPNDKAEAHDGRPALREETLDVYKASLGKTLASGQKLAGPVTVVTKGRHRFVKVALVGADKGVEEAYVTASPTRIYVFYTTGLAQEPWMRPTLERMLDTFDFQPTKR